MRSGDVLANRFVIDRLAGRGGMGEVYCASDRETGQLVAVKVLRGEGAGNIVRFEREARILSKVDDSRVVRHVAHGKAPSGDPYLVMEWLEGEDLAQRLSRGRLGTAESVALCADVAGALGRLHEKGIVHRDLKPSNVFLVGGRTSDVKLLDFGIAQIAASTRVTWTGAQLGTFGYMAPEQANGTKDIDARADVFALGCVLFECIAGEPAFGGTHPLAILTKILIEETPLLEKRMPDVPVELDTLVGRLLSKNRDDRPRNGHAVAKALRALENLPRQAIDKTVHAIRAPALQAVPALTDSEQRALAVILVSAPANDSEAHEAEIEAAARAHGATMTRLLNGSLALLVSSTGVVTDLAAQGARCALAVSACAAGRRVVLAMGRSHGTESVPMGPAIDQAARLLGSGSPESGVVSIDDASVGLLDARFNVRDESGVYVLSGERDVAEVRTLLGKPTPCVGRERELRTLQAQFDDCTGDEPRAQVALVTALPGVGKSRLGREFLQTVQTRSESVSLWTARGEPLRAGSAFALASQLVESAAGIRGGEPVDVRREKLGARVAEHVAATDQQRVTVFLGEMIGAPFPDEGNLPLRAARADAQLMNDQMRTAFADFLAAECEFNPVLVFLEDLHWGDTPTVEVLGRALGDLAEKPIFVLALARPEVHEVFPTLWAGRFVQENRMNELSKKAAERLVRHVLGERVTGPTVQKIVELSAGNAFYLEELIRAAAEGRGDDLPDTVVAMVQSRLGVLSDAERRLLRAASVFGETFWAGAVSTLLGDLQTSIGKVDEKLRAFVGKELFLKRAESRFPNETEYAFRHALLREGAYTMLTDDDRRLGHRLAGEWLQRMGEDDSVVLAEHFEKGGEGAKAGEQWALAAERAFQGMDTQRGIGYAHRGLACPISTDIRKRLLGTLCQLHTFRLEGLATARPHADELLEISQPGSTEWAQAMLVVIVIATQGGDMEAFARALRTIMTVEMQPESAEVALLVGSTCYVLDLYGNIAQSDAVFEKLESLARNSGEHVSGALTFYHLLLGVRSAQARQNPLVGLNHGRTAVQLAQTMGHRRYASIISVFVAINSWFLGANAAAKTALMSVNASDGEHGLASSMRPVALAWLLADAGSLDEARTCALDLVTRSQTRSLPLDEARGHWVLAEVLRRMGDLDAANTEIETALLMLRMVCPLDVPGALATLAALRRAQGKPDEALAAAEEGMTRMDAMGGACSQFFRNAFLRLEHAEALNACGRGDDAKVAITKAREWLYEVVAKIGDDEYKKSFLENVPENRRIIELAERWQVRAGK